MPNYRNKRVTIFKEDNQTRIPVSTILSDADLNGKTIKDHAIFTLLDAKNKPVGEDIKLEPGHKLSGF